MRSNSALRGAVLEPGSASLPAGSTGGAATGAERAAERSGAPRAVERGGVLAEAVASRAGLEALGRGS